jgi:Flp pilus assembly protein TadD
MSQGDNMAARTRLVAWVGLLALVLAGVGCKHEEKDTTPQATGERSPELTKALRRAQARAERRPRDLPAQLEAGKLCYEQGFYNDAYQAYMRAVNVEPQNLEAMVGLARTNLKLQNPTQGLDWVGRARRIKPDDTDLVELEARLFLLSGQMDQAIAGFRRATVLSPGEATTWLNLASAYAVTRQYAQAAAAAQKAVALAPDSAAAHFALGRFSEKSGNATAAEREYRAALRLEPKHTASLVALASLLVARKQNLDEARKLAVLASQVEAERADAAILAAWILHLQGADDKAADELGKIVGAMPQNPEAWQKLAVVLRRLGRKDQAKQAEEMAAQFLAQSRPAEMDFIEGRR